MRSIISRVAMTGAFLSLVPFAVQEATAQQGGGGARGGASMSMGRGGAGSNAGGGGSFSREGNYSRPSGAKAADTGASRRGTGTTQRPTAGSSQRQGAGGTQRPSQGGNVGSGNRGNISTGDINRGNISTGDINIGTGSGGGTWGGCSGSNCNINVKHEYKYGGWGGYYDYPHGAYAAGVITGAAITAAAIGTRYYTLPPACSPYPYGGYTYYTCGGAWYYPQYQGDTVVYVVVAKPF